MIRRGHTHRHLAIGMFILAACTQPDRTAGPLPPVESSAQHAVYSEQLLEAMYKLERLATIRLPQEMDLATEQERRAVEIARIARTLADTADLIPDVLADVDLSVEHQVLFRDLARELGVKARSLADEAPGQSLRATHDQVNALLASCTGCHDRFRVLPRLR